MGVQLGSVSLVPKLPAQERPKTREMFCFSCVISHSCMSFWNTFSRPAVCQECLLRNAQFTICKKPAVFWPQETPFKDAWQKFYAKSDDVVPTSLPEEKSIELYTSESQSGSIPYRLISLSARRIYCVERDSVNFWTLRAKNDQMMGSSGGSGTPKT